MEEWIDDFREFLIWYKVINFSRVRDILLEELPDDSKKVVYMLSIIDRTSDEIEKLTEKLGYKVPSSTIRNWQSRWVSRGIMRQVSPRKRERVFDLDEFKINIGAAFKSLD